jgi:hypothetical protein
MTARNPQSFTQGIINAVESALPQSGKNSADSRRSLSGPEPVLMPAPHSYT